MNTLQSYWNAVSHWWAGNTPTGKCLCAVGLALVVIAVLIVVV